MNKLCDVELNELHFILNCSSFCCCALCESGTFIITYLSLLSIFCVINYLDVAFMHIFNLFYFLKIFTMEIILVESLSY